MTNQWYYSDDENKHGPYTDRELRDLADAGDIIPTTIIWKQGIEQGKVASEVKNLFPINESANPLADEVIPAEEPIVDSTSESVSSDALIDSAEHEMDTDHEEELPETAMVPPEVPEPVVPTRNAYQQDQQKKARATVVKGAVLISQDGTNARIRKKCAKCGHEDSSVSRLLIRPGSNTTTFFCPKCKKIHPVELRGAVSAY